MSELRSAARRRRSLAGRLMLAFLAVLPTAVKAPLLRLLFGFRIGRRVSIGVAYLDCETLALEDDVRIGHGVAFVRTRDVRVGSHARIGPFNIFRGGEHIDIGSYGELLRFNVVNAIPDHDCAGSPDSTFSLGYGAVVTASHWIDFTDRVTVGRRSIVGGRNSSIWTHNRKRSAPVSIGDFCYLGSEVRVAPGATIESCSIVGMGSVVSSGASEPFTVIAGSPAKIIRRVTDDDTDTLFGKTRPDLPDEALPEIPRTVVS